MVFLLFKDRKKALIITIVTGILLVIMAAVLLPPFLSRERAPKYKQVDGVVTDFYDDPATGTYSEDWIEYSFAYKGEQYSVRVTYPIDDDPFIYVGREKWLYVNTKDPSDALQYPPTNDSGSLDALPWLAMSPIALLFVIMLINYLLIRKKEEKASAEGCMI